MCEWGWTSSKCFSSAKSKSKGIKSLYIPFLTKFKYMAIALSGLSGWCSPKFLWSSIYSSNTTPTFGLTIYLHYIAYQPYSFCSADSNSLWFYFWGCTSLGHQPLPWMPSSFYFSSSQSASPLHAYPQQANFLWFVLFRMWSLVLPCEGPQVAEWVSI